MYFTRLGAIIFSNNLKTNSSMTSWWLVWFWPGKRKGIIFLCRQTNDQGCCLRGIKNQQVFVYGFFFFVFFVSQKKKIRLSVITKFKKNRKKRKETRTRCFK